MRNDVTVTGVQVFESEIGNQGIDVLIGMDIISLGNFSVSNYNGKTQFTFGIPSQADTDYVKMIINITPVRNEKTYPNAPYPCRSEKNIKKAVVEENDYTGISDIELSGVPYFFTFLR